MFPRYKWIFNFHYTDVFISFSNQLFIYLEKYIKEDSLYLVKDMLMDRLYYSVLPFRVWNHLFLYERSESMCRYCSKLYIQNKKISDHINNNLFVPICDFPRQFKRGFSLTYKIPLHVHTNTVMKNDRWYFKILYHKGIDSSLKLWKLYLDILSRVVYNVSYKFIFSLLLSGSTDMNSCCTNKNCILKKNMVEEIFFRELI